MLSLTDAALLSLAEVMEERLGKRSQPHSEETLTWSLQLRGGVGLKGSRGIKEPLGHHNNPGLMALAGFNS